MKNDVLGMGQQFRVQSRLMFIGNACYAVCQDPVGDENSAAPPGREGLHLSRLCSLRDTWIS